MIDDFAKEYLHGDLREVREVLLRKLDGLSEYDVRRPLTPTGTNLLGLGANMRSSDSPFDGARRDPRAETNANYRGW
ncbi:hypothetical protein J2S66_006782 [Saccharothrix longispora]|uniref:Uncharacterized protein n=1 Tax=Saccharothrix longispora TaxID=33920 RepID=A0ABU1Q683_9PSEU|nr:hypothetical protein [Saccharothrix longispora]